MLSASRLLSVMRLLVHFPYFLEFFSSFFWKNPNFGPNFWVNFKILKIMHKAGVTKDKMDLLQETSSEWHVFLSRPCPWVDLCDILTLKHFEILTFWLFAHLTPYALLWMYGTIQYSTVQYSTIVYFKSYYFSYWYTPLVEVNQAINAWSFRQKV